VATVVDFSALTVGFGHAKNGNAVDDEAALRHQLSKGFRRVFKHRRVPQNQPRGTSFLFTIYRPCRGVILFCVLFCHVMSCVINI
jgi:hypothetical protein